MIYAIWILAIKSKDSFGRMAETLKLMGAL